MPITAKFDVVRAFVPDYMHSVLLGAVRQFVFRWFDSTSNDKPYNLRHRIMEIDTALLATKPPFNIKRLPHSILSGTYGRLQSGEIFYYFTFQFFSGLYYQITIIVIGIYWCIQFFS